MRKVAVIMAGGKGERFWPKSRANLPKQFLSLTDDGITMLQHTVNRLLPMVSIKDIFIVTNENYVDLIKKQLKDMPPENILAEPKPKNTAPCIALAVAVIEKKYDDAIMFVLPSDHLIKFNDIFLDTLTQAAEVAEKGKNIVTIGITPNYAETGYGYINFSTEGDDKCERAYKVVRFVEKPNLEKAREYLSSGKYLWNSGMFVWKLSSITENFRLFQPEMFEEIGRISAAFGTPNFEAQIAKSFEAMPAESIDYGIMEKADSIFTIPGNFGWDDVGSWLAIERINPTNDDGNVVRGDVVTIGTENSIIIGGKRLVAVIGMQDVVIVDTDDVILICDKNDTQKVKKVIENLKICNRNDLV